MAVSGRVPQPGSLALLVLEDLLQRQAYLLHGDLHDANHLHGLRHRNALVELVVHVLASLPDELLCLRLAQLRDRIGEVVLADIGQVHLLDPRQEIGSADLAAGLGPERLHAHVLDLLDDRVMLRSVALDFCVLVHDDGHEHVHHEQHHHNHVCPEPEGSRQRVLLPELLPVEVAEHQQEALRDGLREGAELPEPPAEDEHASDDVRYEDDHEHDQEVEELTGSRGDGLGHNRQSRLRGERLQKLQGYQYGVPAKHQPDGHEVAANVRHAVVERSDYVRVDVAAVPLRWLCCANVHGLPLGPFELVKEDQPQDYYHDAAEDHADVQPDPAIGDEVLAGPTLGGMVELHQQPKSEPEEQQTPR
mmetsp:Transcript_12864/g.29184  ORF Transcript_12864/g.29184 Transcript_12864/m.29184 type:complete len:362 (+) Transcript_12864:538-1623(+)